MLENGGGNLEARNSMITSVSMTRSSRSLSHSIQGQTARLSQVFPLSLPLLYHCFSQNIVNLL